MGKNINLTGVRFGRLLVEKFKELKDHQKYWTCICDCGNTAIVSTAYLRRGSTESCGLCTLDGIVEYYKYENCYVGEFTISKEQFFVDIDIYEKIKDFKLYIRKDANSHYIIINCPFQLSLHRFIMNADKGDLVDHVDQNGMNNLRNNLRICDKQKNSFNHRISKRNSTGVTGVHPDKNKRDWTARIMFNGKNLWLGSYGLIENAIKARLYAEKKLFKEFSPQRHLFEQYGIT